MQRYKGLEEERAQLGVPRGEVLGGAFNSIAIETED